MTTCLFRLGVVGMIFALVVLLSVSFEGIRDGHRVKSPEVYDHEPYITQNIPRCRSPEHLKTYFDLEHYNRSYPHVDYAKIVMHVVDMMLNPYHIYADSGTYITMPFLEACSRPQDEEAEVFWNEFVYAVNNTLHNHETTLLIAQSLFGHALGSQLMDPPDYWIFPQINWPGRPNEQDKACYYQLAAIYKEHCGGVLDRHRNFEAFSSMCTLGVSVAEFAAAASQTCQGYTKSA